MRFRNWLLSENVIDLRLRIPGMPGYKDGYFIVLGPGDETLFYLWGQNRVPWKEVLDKAEEFVKQGGFQRSPEDILIYQGKVIISSYTGNEKWSGIRSKYSQDVKKIVQELLRRNLIQSNTLIALGNWASKANKSIGTASQIVKRADVPDRIVVYHGTSSHHLDKIMKEGLKVVPYEERVWKDIGGKRGHPEHRESAIYFTTDASRAAYYAGKAVNVMRRKGYKQIKPVVLKITLTKRNYPNLLADDDWLRRNPGASSSEWYHSLSEFGQIACNNCIIAPEQIQVVS